VRKIEFLLILAIFANFKIKIIQNGSKKRKTYIKTLPKQDPHTVKKGIDFPVPNRDATNQHLPGGDN
jgi:hypothetical protein